MPVRENKYQRYTRRCVEQGRCPRCGKPSAPYYYCPACREYKNAWCRGKSRRNNQRPIPEALVYRPRSDALPLPAYCPQGHEMTEGNTYVVPGKRRTFRCKACDRDRMRANAAAPERHQIDELPLPCRSEPEAITFLEALRWPEGGRCPRCDGWNVHAMNRRGMPGVRADHWRWKCNECRQQFSVRTGTPFENSRLPLHTWLHAIYRRKDGAYSPYRFQRETGLTYKTCLRVMDTVTLILADEPGESVFESPQRRRMYTERMARTRLARDASERYTGLGRHAEAARQEREKREWQRAAQLLKTLREALQTGDLGALRSPSAASGWVPTLPS